jgi:antitoxin FitA
MKIVEVNLPEPTAAKLEAAAELLKVSPEEVLSLEEKLAQLDPQFQNASEYVINKNAELYKRLA